VQAKRRLFSESSRLDLDHLSDAVVVHGIAPVVFGRRRRSRVVGGVLPPGRSGA
jgi:hypothetical protein